jgi:hypothetical protein
LAGFKALVMPGDKTVINHQEAFPPQNKVALLACAGRGYIAGWCAFQCQEMRDPYMGMASATPKCLNPRLLSDESKFCVD